MKKFIAASLACSLFVACAGNVSVDDGTVTSPPVQTGLVAAPVVPPPSLDLVTTPSRSVRVVHDTVVDTVIRPPPPTTVSIEIPDQTVDVDLSYREVEIFTFYLIPEGGEASLRYFSVNTGFAPPTYLRQEGSTLWFEDMRLFVNDEPLAMADHAIYSFSIGREERLENRVAGMWKYIVLRDEFRFSERTKFSIRARWTGTPLVGDRVLTTFDRSDIPRQLMNTGVSGSVRGTLWGWGSVVMPCAVSDTCAFGGSITWSNLAAGSRHSAAPGRESNDWLLEDTLPGFDWRRGTTVRVASLPH